MYYAWLRYAFRTERHDWDFIVKPRLVEVAPCVPDRAGGGFAAGRGGVRARAAAFVGVVGLALTTA